MRKAVEQLSAEGLVYTAQGSGTSVSTTHPNAVPFRFADCAPSIPPPTGLSPRRLSRPRSAIAERLSLPLGEPVIPIRRLRLEGEAVAGFSERFLPQSLCPDLLAEDLTQQSIHDILVNRSERPLLRAVVEIERKTYET